MIPRLATTLFKELAEQFPAVLLLGPRQSGKTTLARSEVHGTYFDLERPSDYQVFADDPAYALERLPAPLILDEAQVLPSLFASLRSVIDADRTKNGRFFLLGSVNPGLVRHVSESLAGRVGRLELTPFLYPELAATVGGPEECHLRGGFPGAALEANPARRTRWIEQYLSAMIGRDLLPHGIQASAQEMGRFLAMLAHLHGGLANASDLGRSLGVSYHTIQNYLDILEGHFLIRRLPPWHQNAGKRLVKSPKIYLRDSGLLHGLLGIRTERDLLSSPKRGASWEGWVIEQCIALENLRDVGTRFWFYRSHTGTEIDLILDRGEERIGVEIKASSAVSKGDARGLTAGMEDKILTRGYVVYAGEKRYSMNDRIDVVPAAEFLQTNVSGLGR